MFNSEQKTRVLIVDDHHINRLLLKMPLERAGFEVTSAAGGADAIKLIGIDQETPPTPPFDMIVLDIMMPDISGMEVLRRIRKIHPPQMLPVIMATAKEESKDIVDALQLGANDYVTKPIDIPVLLARIEVHVALHETHMKLQLAQSSLIDAAKMESIGRLSAGVAHEVKNPLYVLQMGVDFFLMKGDANDEHTGKTLKNMQNAIDRADSIIRSMVDFSRTEELRLVESDLNELIEQALVLVRHGTSARQITLDVQLGGDLPPVLADRTKIEQVMINLLTNACHAMEDGGRLQVRSRRIDPGMIDPDDMDRRARKIREFKNGVMVEIIDEGTGIPDEYMLKLFDPFFTSKAAGKGTGLGLSVTKTIIDLHGGFIELGNAEPKGARACVYLDANGPLAATAS
jgi:signal transduction histidine kinase